MDQEYRLARIEPVSTISLPRMQELWAWRELFLLLAWRDIKVRYKQAVLGVAWALLTPLAFMGAFTLFFGVIFATPTDGIPRPVFIFTGILTWLLFAEAINDISSSLVKDRHIFEKLYFPRLLIPLASVVASLVDFAFGMVALLVMMVIFGVPLIWSIFLVIFWVVAILFIAFSVGVWLAALNLQFHDFRHITPLMIQIWFWATPIFYSVSAIPEKWRFLYRINPMVGMMEGIRSAVFNTPPPSVSLLLVSFIPFAFLLISGLIYFSWYESTFAEKL